MKDRLRQIRDILKANLNPRPVGEDWYENRLKICSECPLNSKNANGQGETWFRKHVISKRDRNGEYCTACGCPIDRKASLTTSVCGISEITELIEAGEKPRWGAIEIENDERFFYSVTNLNHSGCDIDYKKQGDGNFYLLDFGDVVSPLLTAKVKIYSPYKCQYINLEKENCLLTNVEQASDHIIITAVFSTKGQREDVLIDKRFTVYFEQESGNNKAIFSLQGIKRNGL